MHELAIDWYAPLLTIDNCIYAYVCLELVEWNIGMEYRNRIEEWNI